MVLTAFSIAIASTSLYAVYNNTKSDGSSTSQNTNIVQQQTPDYTPEQTEETNAEGLTKLTAEEAIRKVVKLNERFVPPYESGAALYIRPLMLGLGAQVGVKPAPEYMFVVFVTPVGPYFKGGFQPSKVCILREYDRAAPNGTGTIKVGGNYAASLVAGEIAHSKGYAAVLYLDPKEKKYLDDKPAIVDQDEYNEMRAHLPKIVEQVNNYVRTYIDHVTGKKLLHPRQYARSYSFSTLPCFHDVLGIE